MHNLNSTSGEALFLTPKELKILSELDVNNKRQILQNVALLEKAAGFLIRQHLLIDSETMMKDLEQGKNPDNYIQRSEFFFHFNNKNKDFLPYHSRLSNRLGFKGFEKPRSAINGMSKGKLTDDLIYRKHGYRQIYSSSNFHISYVPMPSKNGQFGQFELLRVLKDASKTIKDINAISNEERDSVMKVLRFRKQLNFITYPSDTPNLRKFYNYVTEDGKRSFYLDKSNKLVPVEYEDFVNGRIPPDVKIYQGIYEFEYEDGTVVTSKDANGKPIKMQQKVRYNDDFISFTEPADEAIVKFGFNPVICSYKESSMKDKTFALANRIRQERGMLLYEARNQGLFEGLLTEREFNALLNSPIIIMKYNEDARIKGEPITLHFKAIIHNGKEISLEEYHSWKKENMVFDSSILRENGVENKSGKNQQFEINNLNYNVNSGSRIANAALSLPDKPKKSVTNSTSVETIKRN